MIVNGAAPYGAAITFLFFGGYKAAVPPGPGGGCIGYAFAGKVSAPGSGYPIPFRPLHVFFGSASGFLRASFGITCHILRGSFGDPWGIPEEACVFPEAFPKRSRRIPEGCGR
jgi:hypothetical protein